MSSDSENQTIDTIAEAEPNSLEPVASCSGSGKSEREHDDSLHSSSVDSSPVLSEEESPPRTKIASMVDQQLDSPSVKSMHQTIQDRRHVVSLKAPLNTGQIDVIKLNAAVNSALHLADVSSLGAGGNTLLHRAIKEEFDVEVIQALLDIRQIDVNVRNKAGGRALHLLMYSNHHEHETPNILKISIAAGADVSLLAAESNTLLHLATQETLTVEVVRALLDTRQIDVNARNKAGDSALHLLMCHISDMHNILNILRILIAAGADVSLLDARGNTLLHGALRGMQNVEVIQALLDTRQIDVNVRNKAGYSALHLLMYHDKQWLGDVWRFLVPDKHRTQNILKILITAGADVSLLDAEGDTLLHRAIKEEQDVEVIQALLDTRQIDVNARNKAGYSALHLLMYHGDQPLLGNGWRYLEPDKHRTPNILKILIAAGADVSLLDAEGDTLLHRAIEEKWDVEVIQALLDTRQIDVNARNKAGYSALHLLMYHGYQPWLGDGWRYLKPDKHWTLNILKILIAAGADVSLLDAGGDTLLHGAIRGWQDVEVIQALLDTRQTDINIDIDARNKAGDSALHLLMYCKYYDHTTLNILKFLIAVGADVSLLDAEGNTLLHRAILGRQDVEVIQALLDTRQIDVNVQNLAGHSAVQIMLKRFRDSTHVNDIMLCLIRAGADSSGSDMSGNTCLHLAVRHDQYELVHNLLLSGASADVPNQTDGNLPLHLSMYKKSNDMVKSLLKVTSDVNSCSKSGSTPLHCASESGDHEYIQFLIDAGANLNQLDSYGWAPLHICAKHHHWRAAERLVDGGAEKDLPIYSTDRNPSHHQMMTPLLVAIYYMRRLDDLKTVDILIRKQVDTNKQTSGGLRALHLANILHCRLKPENCPELTSSSDFQTGEVWKEFYMDFEQRKRAYNELENLLIRETNLNFRGSHGNTSLHIAASHGQYKLITKLLSQNANANITNDDGWLPLHLLNVNDPDLVLEDEEASEALMTLLDKTNDINQPNPNNGWTILHHLIEADADATLRFFVEKSAIKCDVIDKKGHTAVQFAAARCAHGWLRYLNKKHRNWSVKDSHGRTMLHLCVLGPITCPEKMKKTITLLARESNTTSVDNNGYTALHYAIECGELLKAAISRKERVVEEGMIAGILQQLFSCTSTENTRTRQTLLHAAAISGSVPVCEFLLSRHLSVNKQDSKNQTPLHLSAINGHASLAALLLEKNADVNLEDDQKRTPLLQAIYHAHRDVTRVILQKMKSRKGREAGSSKLELHAVIKREHEALLKFLETEKPENPTNILRNWYCAIVEGDFNFDLVHLLQPSPLTHADDTKFTYCPVLNNGVRCADKDSKDKTPAYKMSATPRGRAIILNIMNFKDKPQTTREGSDVDVKNLSRLFRQLGFIVNIWNDISKAELRDKIAAEKVLPEHKEADAFVMVAMSHGGANKSFTLADGERINIEDDLVTPFDGKNWPTMIDKPKIFIFQCCRGSSRTSPVRTVVQPDGDPHITCSDDEFHPKSDVIKIFSTYDNDVALRDKEWGSWFVQNFVLVTELYAHQDHLLDLLLKVNRLLPIRQDYYTAAVQIPQEDLSLRKHLYFFPTADEEKPLL